MKIAIIGTGYVGLPTGVGFAELGNKVVCIDNDTKKITSLREGKITLFEDGLEDLLKKNHQNGNITFTTSMEEGVSGADVVIIAVGTPPHPVTKEADLKYIYAAATELAQYITDYTVIATKSTVPIGTGDKLEELISKANPQAQFDVVSLPEFLREGYAVYDFFNPDRIIVGSDNEKATKVITKLYEPFASKTNILYVKRRSSETIKYASNSFLAIKIQYINEIADFCEATGANVLEVAKGMGLDTRIGTKFLNPGPGFGGSCFPKDTQALKFMSKQYNVELSLIEATITGNIARKKKMATKILAASTTPAPNIAILGLTFKNGTDDCRESPAMEIVSAILEQNPHAKITAFDPQGMKNAELILGDKIKYAPTMYDTLKDAEVLAVLTEWPEFKELDLSKCASLMKHKCICDFRNLLNAQDAQNQGFTYHGIGR